jgi:hypothetical protein
MQIQKQILGPSLDCADSLSFKLLCEISRYWPAKVVVAYGYSGNNLAFTVRCYTSASDFNFGKFGHALTLLREKDRG